MIRPFIPNIDLFKYFQGQDLEKAEKEEETEQLQHRQLQPQDHLISTKQTMLEIQAMKYWQHAMSIRLLSTLVTMLELIQLSISLEVFVIGT